MSKISIGNTFENLTIVDIVTKNDGKRNRLFCECVCSCGNKLIVREDRLTSGKATHCGCLKELKRIEALRKTELEEVGKTHGFLTVIRRDPDNKNKYICKCACGVEKSVSLSSAKSGHIVGCGCGGDGYIDLVGEKFGKWLVVGKTRIQSGKKNIVGWNVVCECGSTSVVSTDNLKSGDSKSCGCTRKLPRIGTARVLKTLKLEEDMVGKTFHNLTVKTLVGKDDTGHYLVECTCICGNTVVFPAKKVRLGKNKSCGCKSKKFQDMTGQQHGRWTVISFAGYNKCYNSTWNCRCACGTERVVLGYQLRNKVSTSCGCYHHEELIERNTTHGLSHTAEYKAHKTRKRLEKKRILDTEWSLEMEQIIRDLFPACVVCGMTNEEHINRFNKALHVDHVESLNSGSGLNPGNAVILCQTCNSSKGKKSITALPQDVQDKIISAAALFKEVWDNYVPEVYEEDIEDLSDWEGWQ